MKRIVVTDLDDTSVLVEISEEDLATLSELENRSHDFVYNEKDETRIRSPKAIERYNRYLGQLITLGKYNGNDIDVYKPITT